MKRMTTRVYGKSSLVKGMSIFDLKEAVDLLAAYEDTGLEPQLVQLLADAICGKTGVFCSKCGDGLCLAAGKDGLEIGCFGCGEYVPVRELFEIYRAMKEGEGT